MNGKWKCEPVKMAFERVVHSYLVGKVDKCPLVSFQV